MESTWTYTVTGDGFGQKRLFPQMPANESFTFVEEHLAEHVEGYLRRFERWHGTKR